MIRSPLALRIPSDGSIRELILKAAHAGARGVVLDAVGDLSPDRLSETGRRELRHALRSAELDLVAIGLPTRRGFDSIDQLDDRLRRADRAFALAYELQTKLVLVRVGPIPAETDKARSDALSSAIGELDSRADRRGVQLAIETEPEPPAALASLLERFASPNLKASLDPATLLRGGQDPVAAAVTLGKFLIHVYASSSSSQQSGIANPRGFGFAPGVLDWEEYLGALEEVNYRGYLTVWPDQAQDPIETFQTISKMLTNL